MGRLVIPGVCQKKGITYRRFRVKRDGKWMDDYVRLPDPSDPKFAIELARVNKSAQPRAEARDGTIAALAIEFRRMLAANRHLAEATRRNQLVYCERIESEHGHRMVRDLRPKDVFTIRNRMAETPGTANNYVAVLRKMMRLACELGWRDNNPASGVEPLRLGEHEPWPVEVLKKALAAARGNGVLAGADHRRAVAGCTGRMRAAERLTPLSNWR